MSTSHPCHRLMRLMRRSHLGQAWCALLVLLLLEVCTQSSRWSAAAEGWPRGPSPRHATLQHGRALHASIETAYGVPTPPPPAALPVWRQFLLLHAAFKASGFGDDPTLFLRWAMLHGVTDERDLQLMLALYLWMERFLHQ